MRNQSALTLLCLSLFLIPATVEAKEKAFISEKLDQATNQTQLSTNWLHYGRTLPSIDIQALYSYNSRLEASTYPDYVLFKAVKWSHYEGKPADPNMELTLSTDGTQVSSIKPAEYQIEQLQRGLLKESTTFKIPAYLFHRITTSAKVEGHLGGTLLLLSHTPQFEALKQLCNEVDRFSNKTTVSKAEP